MNLKKTTSTKSPMYLFLILSLAWALNSPVGAEPEPATPPAKAHPVDHRSDARSSSSETSPDTIRVMVYKHEEYQNGKYVWVPSYTANAPRPPADAKVYWVPPGYVRGEDGYQPGHWSMTAGIEAIPVR